MTAEEEGEATDHGGFLATGVILGVLASMSGTAGKQFLRFSELQRRKGTPSSICLGRAALAVGLGLNVIVGPLIDMGSYAFAPQSVIAPLGALDVVWNTLTAPFTLGETLTARLFVGCVVITGGAVTTSLVGSHDSGDFTMETIERILLRPAVGIYLAVFLVWVIFNVLVLMPRSAAPKGQPWASGDRLRGLSLGMTAGSIAGNMFCVKAFVEVCQASVRENSHEYWLHWMPYGLFAGALVFAFSNLYFLTKAMQEYPALFMGAVFEGSLIVSACVSGVVVFSEMEKLELWQVVIYWASLLAIVAGIFTVSRGSTEERPSPCACADAEPSRCTDAAGEGAAGACECAAGESSSCTCGVSELPGASDTDNEEVPKAQVDGAMRPEAQHWKAAPQARVAAQANNQDKRQDFKGVVPVAISTVVPSRRSTAWFCSGAAACFCGR